MTVLHQRFATRIHMDHATATWAVGLYKAIVCAEATGAVSFKPPPGYEMYTDTWADDIVTGVGFEVAYVVGVGSASGYLLVWGVTPNLDLVAKYLQAVVRYGNLGIVVVEWADVLKNDSMPDRGGGGCLSVTKAQILWDTTAVWAQEQRKAFKALEKAPWAPFSELEALKAVWALAVTHMKTIPITVQGGHKAETVARLKHAVKQVETLIERIEAADGDRNDAAKIARDLLLKQGFVISHLLDVGDLATAMHEMADPGEADKINALPYADLAETLRGVVIKGAAPAGIDEWEADMIETAARRLMKKHGICVKKDEDL